MRDDDEYMDDGSQRYEINKKYRKPRDQDKKIRSPVSKGSIRSQRKGTLRRYLDIVTTKGIDGIDEDDFEDWDDDNR